MESAIKNGAEVTFNLFPNIIGDFNDKNDFLHKLLLSNTQVLNLRKAFAHNWSANIKQPKTELYKIGQSGGF